MQSTEKPSSSQRADAASRPVHHPAPGVVEAIQTRHSVREYQQRPIEPQLLRELLEHVLRAPSWKNAQPWKFYAVTGAARNRVSEALVAAALGGEPAPDLAWPEVYPPAAKRRMFDLGMQIYGVAGIDRKDRAARDQFMLDNFRFFGAPAAIFIATDFDCNFFTGLDIGCALQTILLASRAFGLGTCAQAALGAFPDVVRCELDLPANEKIVCGVSLGYPRENSRLNEFHTPRIATDQGIRIYD